MNSSDSVIIEFLKTVVTALVTAYVTFWVNWRKARTDLENEFQRRFNDKKWEVYTKFMKFLHRYTDKKRDDLDNNSDSELILLASQILLAGSDKTVEAFRLWRESAKVHGDDDEITKEKLFKLIREMRRDLGNRQTRLESDILWNMLNLTPDE
ncbi:MAG: hypothetical protein HRF47_00700 [Chloroflexota bacterium]|jgi:hypothetical protein